MNKFLLVLFSVFYLSFGFNQVNDAGYWSELELEKKINLRSSVSLSENIRLIENFTRVSTHFTQLSYKYKILSNLNVALSYRFAQRFKYDETMNYRNRFMLDLNYEIKLKKLNIGFRERYQRQYEDAMRNNWNEPISTFRSKINFEYDLEKKYKPYFSAEVFLKDFKMLNNLRFCLGASYKFNKKISLTLAYIINKEVQVANPMTFYLVSSSVKYVF